MFFAFGSSQFRFKIDDSYLWIAKVILQVFDEIMNIVCVYCWDLTQIRKQILQTFSFHTMLDIHTIFDIYNGANPILL